MSSDINENAASVIANLMSDTGILQWKSVEHLHCYYLLPLTRYRSCPPLPTDVLFVHCSLSHTTNGTQKMDYS
jgi:hypothetical protein